MKADTMWSVVRRFTRGFVLAFHDIDAFHMEQLVDALAPIQPVPLSDLARRSKLGKPTAGLCAITVDDGIAQTTHGLAAVCRKRAWPITFFIPTANIDTGAGFAFEWWRKIQPFLGGRKWLLSAGPLDLRRPEAVSELAATMERLWHTSPSDLYLPFTMELVSTVTRELEIPLDSIRPARPLTWEEVVSLSQDDLLAFESHGVAHVALSSMSPDEVSRELLVSRDSIQDRTGKPCRHFCYPFGSARSIGSIAPSLVTRFYESAVTMSLGHIDGADPALMPRIPLYPENSVAMARAKVGLKCSSFSTTKAHSHPAPGAPLGATASS